MLHQGHISRCMTKPTKWLIRPAKTQMGLGIRPVWSVSSLSAWRKLGSWATHLAHSKDSDQTGRMIRLMWVFAGRTVILLILTWGGSFILWDLWNLLEIKLFQNIKWEDKGVPQSQAAANPRHNEGRIKSKGKFIYLFLFIHCFEKVILLALLAILPSGPLN